MSVMLLNNFVDPTKTLFFNSTKKLYKINKIFRKVNKILQSKALIR